VTFVGDVMAITLLKWRHNWFFWSSHKRFFKVRHNLEKPQFGQIT